MIDITLREILIHVFTKNGNQFFVDNEGLLLPFSTKIKENLIITIKTSLTSRLLTEQMPLPDLRRMQDGDNIILLAADGY